MARPALYSVNNLLLTDPQKLKLPEWHVKPGSCVDFLLRRTSVQILCSLRCSSDLLWIRPRKVKKQNKTQKKKNRNKNKQNCGTRSRCTMSADSFERQVQMIFYLWSGRSNWNECEKDNHCKCRMLHFLFISQKRPPPMCQPSCRTKTVRLFTRLEQISPVFIVVVSVNVAVVFQPAHR